MNSPPVPTSNQQDEPELLPPEISIIVPTYREVENLTLLVERISEVLTKPENKFEIIIVDDNSCDGTVELCSELAKTFPLRLEVRTQERGLSTAVIHGMKLAIGKFLVCMDADLSHPPEKIPELISTLQESETDFVIGSRYVAGASTDEQWGWFRWWNSRIATWMARPLTTARDPMAGFFALRRETFQQAQFLDPVGYKIGLELIVKGHCKNVREIPIHFSDRLHGESKLSFKEQLNYGIHLKRLMEYRYKNVMYLLEFGLVGLSGMVVDLLIYSFLLSHIPMSWARGIAIWFAMTWNFIFNRVVTFSQPEDVPIGRQYVKFCLSCLAGAIVNYFVSLGATQLEEPFRCSPLLGAIMGIIAGFGFNFLICRFWVFVIPKQEEPGNIVPGDET